MPPTNTPFRSSRTTGISPPLSARNGRRPAGVSCPSPRTNGGRLAAIRCGDFGTLELRFKDDPVRVVVGAASPAADLALFRSSRTRWEGLFGPLALVNMGFDGRIYVRAAEPAGDGVPQPDQGD